LWPISSAARPKQFLRLFGDHSLYQKTLARMRTAPLDALAAVANARHESLILEQTQRLAGAPPFLLLEPAARDSAPALAVAAAWALGAYGSETVLVATPSDHLVADEVAFADAVARGIALAQVGHIVTFGVRPTFAATEYGYIERGEPVEGHSGAFAAARFHEKPLQAVAESYCAQGDHFWNSGIFIFQVGVFAAEASEHMPDIWNAAVQAVARGAREGSVLRLEEEPFAAARKTSIDYALMERSRRIAVMPVDFAWSDVGNWDAVYQALDKDHAGNVICGDAVVADSFGTLVVADEIKAAMSGLRDMAVVCSRDGVFIAPRAQAAGMKALVGP
jgi:mannose-1-phosphate guanylyltransferase/mannose-1-phosphate guanylyltransferase/mannose-6-phosphate isomerase